MLKTIWSGAITLLLLAGSAEAACPTFPYTFTTETTAVATQVNQNFANVITCFAPLANPSFTGSVGIGTTTPTGSLDVSNGTSDLYVSFASTNYPRIYLGGTAAAGIAGVFDRTSAATATTIYFGEGGDTGGYQFRGSGNAFFQGNVGIGTAAPSYPLQVNGQAAATSFVTTSDRRSKSDIQLLALDALDVVARLKPVTFAWRDPKGAGMSGRQVGFIAQDVEPVIPEAVVTATGPGGMLGVRYDALVPILTKALQQQEAKIAGLVAAVNTLKTANEALAREVDQLSKTSPRGTGGGLKTGHTQRGPALRGKAS